MLIFLNKKSLKFFIKKDKFNVYCREKSLQFRIDIKIKSFWSSPREAYFKSNSLFKFIVKIVYKCNYFLK